MLEQLIKILLIIKMAAAQPPWTTAPTPPLPLGLLSFLTWLGKSKDLGNKLAVARTLVSLVATVGGIGRGKGVYKQLMSCDYTWYLSLRRFFLFLVLPPLVANSENDAHLRCMHICNEPRVSIDYNAMIIAYWSWLWGRWQCESSVWKLMSGGVCGRWH